MWIVLGIGYLTGVLSVWIYWDFAASYAPTEEIADEIGKTVRGVKTMLTRRGLQCADYNGAARKEIG